MNRNCSIKVIPFLILIQIMFIIAPLAWVKGVGTGDLEISPYLPIKTVSPADFNVKTKANGATAADPHVFLVMTKSSYDGLIGSVTVSWAGGNLIIPKSSWTSETDNSKKIPPGYRTEQDTRLHH